MKAHDVPDHIAVQFRHLLKLSAGVSDHPTASGTIIAAAMLTRCIVQLWSSQPKLEPRDIRQRFQGVILVPASRLDWKNNTPFKPDLCGWQ